MSKVAITGNPSGTGTLTIAAPDTNSDATINLPTVTGGEFIVSNASGNVGIGTSSPATKLDVSGPASVTSFTGTTKLGFTTRGSTGATDYSGIDFIGNNQVNPVARIAVLSEGGGSSLRFGTSNNYASGITNTAMAIAADGSQSSVIPGGSTLYPEFKCRAWVNFDGTGTPTIRASGNVSSITDNATGNYTVNFTTAMPDANYGFSVTSGWNGAAASDETTAGPINSGGLTTSSFRFFVTTGGGGAVDVTFVSVQIFR
jgi:hypothetical protein